MVLCLMITLCVNLAHSVGGTRRGHVLQVARRTMPDHRPVGISRSDSRMSRCAAAFQFSAPQWLEKTSTVASTHTPQRPPTPLPAGRGYGRPGVPAPATTGPARTGRPRPGRSSDDRGLRGSTPRPRTCVCVSPCGSVSRLQLQRAGEARDRARASPSGHEHLTGENTSRIFVVA
jgi:hypothetical protein